MSVQTTITRQDPAIEAYRLGLLGDVQGLVRNQMFGQQVQNLRKQGLTDEQIATIRAWADEGAQLNDIQKKMEDELGHRLTYMDTRFMVLDLGLEIKSQESDEGDEEPEINEQGVDAKDLTEDDIEIVPQDASAGNVKVTVDEIARPGVMASGRVTFADGQGGMWYIDQMGRLGVDPDTEGYQPSEEDILAFQKELQRVAG